jgi:glycosidase
MLGAVQGDMQQYREASIARCILLKDSASAALSKPAAVARVMGVLAAVGWLLSADVSHAANVPASGSAWRAEEEVFYLIFVRSFADSNGDHIGDFKGIEQKLPYVQALGATSILLTPIVPSPTYHNYFASRFDDVDRAYGDLASFRHLVKTVHSRGMKIYLDEEIQYTAENHPWWTQSAGHPESKYSDYILYSGPGNTTPDQGWTGAESYTGKSVSIAMVNLQTPAVRHYFDNLFVWWVDPHGDRRFDEGVDGFRIDHMMDDLDGKGKLTNLVAGFWAPLFLHVRTVNPGISIIAEQADWKSFGDDLLKRGNVDIVYAFPLRAAIASLDRDAVAKAIEDTQDKTSVGKGQLIFIENHDTERFASVVDGDPRKERLGAALTILLKGTPLIYYGQEIGMKGKQLHGSSDGNDIPVREAFRWTHSVDGPGSAIWYRDTGPWWTDRYARDDDGISVEEEQGDPASLMAFYQRLLDLRHVRKDLREGDQEVIATDRPALLVLRRAFGQHESLLVVNFSPSPVTGQLRGDALRVLQDGGALRDLLTNTKGASMENGRVQISIAPFGVQLLAVQ